MMKSRVVPRGHPILNINNRAHRATKGVLKSAIRIARMMVGLCEPSPGGGPLPGDPGAVPRLPEGSRRQFVGRQRPGRRLAGLEVMDGREDPPAVTHQVDTHGAEVGDR